VHPTADGAQAWKRICETKAKMVVTDWMMPEMDGLALCRRIRSHQFPHYVYILLLTARDNLSDAVAGLDAGADDYVFKPFDPKLLQARLDAGRRIIELQDNRDRMTLQMVQNDRMASLGHMASGLAHEINNPIGVITGNLNSNRNAIDKVIEFQERLIGLIERRGEPELISEVEQIKQALKIDARLDMINEICHDNRVSAERIRGLILDLNRFCDTDLGEPGQCDVNSIIRRTTSLMANLEKDISFSCALAELVPIQFEADGFKQVLMVLLSNAVHAMDHHGCISVKTTVESGHLTLDVTDSGCGISTRDLQRVFDPFFTTKAPGEGVGLGLSIAKRIVSNHDGTLRAHSELNNGSTFSVQLPY